jgi:hypothetical protein
VVSLSNHELPFDKLRACPVLDTGANGNLANGQSRLIATYFNKEKTLMLKTFTGVLFIMLQIIYLQIAVAANLYRCGNSYQDILS